jgi:hypothetical protein
MHPAIAALLFPLFASAGLPEMPNVSDLNTKSCSRHEQVFLCGTYADRGSAKDSRWADVVEDACNAYKCTVVDVHTNCRKVCSGLMHEERLKICNVCSDPTGTAPPIKPTPAADPPASTVPSKSSESANPEKPPPAAPAPKPSSVTGKAPRCDGAANCDENAGAADTSGEREAHNRRHNYEEGVNETHDHVASSITGALNAIKHLQTEAAVSGSADARERVASDARLVNRAQDALGPSRSGSFTPGDAQKALDGGVRTELTFAALSSQMGEDLSRESERTQKIEDEFHGLALANLQRASGLASTSSGLTAQAPGKPGSKPGTSADDPTSATSLLDSEKRGGTSDFASAGSAAKAAGKTIVDKVNAKIPGHLELSQGNGGSSPSLRDQLKRDLKTKAHAEALDSSSFQGNLSPIPASGRAEGNSTTASAEDAVQAAFRGIRDSTFGLGSSAETEAELRRLTRQDDGSLPAADSPSLFERAHRAHRACQQRSCVVSAAP